MNCHLIPISNTPALAALCLQLTPGALIHDPRIRALLHKIVLRVAADVNLHDDLLQEALITLWLGQLQRPGQKQSWYLRNCHFHLLDFLRRGRSVDAPKHQHLAVEIRDETDEQTEHEVHVEQSKHSVASSVSAGDIIEQLAPRLKPTDRVVFLHLAEGLGLQEIADTLGRSHEAIRKARRRIAAVAKRTGISL